MSVRAFSGHNCKRFAIPAEALGSEAAKCLHGLKKATEKAEMVILHVLWTQRANSWLSIGAKNPKWSPYWPTWAQKGGHFEAQKWQILVGICAWRLYGQNLASCWHVLLGFWAPGADPQLFLRAWSPKWSADWPTWVQKGRHFEAQKWQILVGICAWRLHGQNLSLIHI